METSLPCRQQPARHTYTAAICHLFWPVVRPLNVCTVAPHCGWQLLELCSNVCVGRCKPYLNLTCLQESQLVAAVTMAKACCTYITALLAQEGAGLLTCNGAHYLVVDCDSLVQFWRPMMLCKCIAMYTQGLIGCCCMSDEATAWEMLFSSARSAAMRISWRLK